MITPSFGLTATERVLPRMALDFTTASLDPRVTFTRALNTATVTNSSGYVVPINANLPRFDFDPITLTCKGLLIEESRTNLLLKSQDFSDSLVWVPTRIAVTNAQILSPDGLTNGAKFENTAANIGYVDEFVTTGAGTYAASVYAKSGTNQELQMYFVDVGIVASSTFNLTLGTVVSGAGTMVAVGNGWYKCTIVGTLLAGSNRLRIVNFSSTLGVNIYLWAAQWETGAFGTSYIPTVAASVTRNADVATMTGTNFSSWFNASEGAFALQGFVTPSANTNYFNASDGSINNSLYFDHSGGTIRNVIFSGGAAVTMSTGAIGAVGSNINIVCAYKLNNFAAAKNAGTVATVGSGAVPIGMNQFSIGSVRGLVAFCNTSISKIMYYPQRIINAEVQAFSK